MAEEQDDTGEGENHIGEEVQDGKPTEPSKSNEERAAEKEAAEAAKVEEEATAKAKEAEEGGKEEEEDGGKPAAKGELDIEKWGDHGDVANATLTLIQDAGGTPEQAKALLFDAVQDGDISKVDEAALTELVGSAQAKLVMTGVRQTIADNTAQIEAVTKVANEAAGDAASWAKVAKWAGKNVAQDEMADYKDMLNAGGRKAEYAAKELVSMYNADDANTSVGAGDTVTPDGKGEKQVEGITSAEAGRQFNLAIKRNAPTAEINKILAAKRAGKKQNLG